MKNNFLSKKCCDRFSCRYLPFLIVALLLFLGFIFIPQEKTAQAFTFCRKLPEFSLVGISNGKIIFSHYDGENSNRSMIISQGDITKNNIQDLGSIRLPEVWSKSCTVINRKIYSYTNHFLPFDSLQAPVTSLISVDTFASSISSIGTESLQQSLVYITSIDDVLYALKGTSDNITGITYIEAVDPETLSADIVLRETYDIASKTGCLIRQFCSFENLIYTFSLEQKDSYKQFYIDAYTPSGTLINRWRLNDEVVFEGIVSTLIVVEEYVFLSGSNGHVLYRLDDKDATKIFTSSDEYHLDAADTLFPQTKTLLLFQREQKRLYLLDTSKHLFRLIDTGAIDNCNRFRSVDVDENGDIYLAIEGTSNERILYRLNLDSLRYIQSWEI